MDSNFDPYTQNFTLRYPNDIELAVPLHDVEMYLRDAVKMCVVFAVQVGAASILLILLAVLTKPDKRRAPLFFINFLSLALVVVRSVLQIVYYLGPWYRAFTYLAYYYEEIPRSAKHTSNATSVVQLLLQICIQISLIMQVRVVYSNMPAVSLAMTMVTVSVGTVSVGFFIATVVQACIAVENVYAYHSAFVYSTARALFAASICLHSLVFVVKLGMAIHKRKQLGLERFGPLQIIFIMGCQTMVVPALCSVLENTTEGMASMTSSLVALSLPLSSMWAAAKTDAPVASQAIGAHQMFPPSPKPGAGSAPMSSVTPANTAACTSCTSSPKRAGWGKDSKGTISGVKVERTFDVQIEEDGDMV